MNEFKVGQRVRIKNFDYLYSQRHTPPSVVGSMFDYAGRVAVIQYINDDRVTLDRFGWAWSTDWLEPVEEPISKIDNREVELVYND